MQHTHVTEQIGHPGRAWAARARSTARGVWLFLLLAALGPAVAAPADNALCARVKIEVRQEITLERQAFDAHMRISNGLTTSSLDQVSIDVTFADAHGAPVLASSDPTNTEALFFVRVDRLEGIDDVSGTGSVAAASVADIHWLIIPAPGASNGLATGMLYFVGAELRYTLGGREQVVEVAPDFIFVKPLPELTLDYFLPAEVYGDDAFTAEIEPPVPFSLGLRVKNSGSGTAWSLNLESSDVEIVENEQGLAINFVITAGALDGSPVPAALHIDLGDVAPGASTVARWTMICTLSGEFVEFTADFSHADELGGELTSLIQATNTHTLIRDVRVDLPGRDPVRDFLARDGDVPRLYESSGLDTDVTDRSAEATLGDGGRREAVTQTLSFPATAGPVWVKLPDPFNGEKVITGAVRDDGKTIDLANVWLSQSRNEDMGWDYFIDLFDVNSTGVYTITFDEPSAIPQAPVLQYIPDRDRFETEQLSFVVVASDPNGTVPQLATGALPVGAAFIDQGDGTGIFDWTPAIGQAGSYTVVFRASDGEQETTQACQFTIHGEEVFTLQVPGATDPTLHYGFRAGATTAFDPNLDAEATPPQSGTVSACLHNLDADSTPPRLRDDYRPLNEPARWRLVVEVPAARDGTVISWDVARAADDKAMFLQRLEHEMPVGAPIDMRAVGQTEIHSSGVWEICYGTLHSRLLVVHRGWNLLGFPLMSQTSAAMALADGDRAAVIGSPLWLWQQGYQRQPDTEPLNPERGYWIECVRSFTSSAIQGLEADGRMALQSGWNLISPVRDTDLPTHPYLRGNCWAWDPGRGQFRAVTVDERLQAGVAYWIYCTREPCFIDTGAN